MENFAAYQAGTVKDTCGCGDWTTAELLAKLCAENSINVNSLSEDKVIHALRYGQALAAWNCNFEVARGGMYIVSKNTFNKDIRQILLESDSKLLS